MNTIFTIPQGLLTMGLNMYARDLDEPHKFAVSRHQYYLAEASKSQDNNTDAPDDLTLEFNQTPIEYYQYSQITEEFENNDPESSDSCTDPCASSIRKMLKTEEQFTSPSGSDGSRETAATSNPTPEGERVNLMSSQSCRDSNENALNSSPDYSQLEDNSNVTQDSEDQDGENDDESNLANGKFSEIRKEYVKTITRKLRKFLKDNKEFRQEVQDDVCIGTIVYDDFLKYLEKSFSGDIILNGKKVCKSRNLQTLFQAIGNEVTSRFWWLKTGDTAYQGATWSAFQILLDGKKVHFKKWVKTYYYKSDPKSAGSVKKGRIYLKYQEELCEHFKNPNLFIDETKGRRKQN